MLRLDAFLMLKTKEDRRMIRGGSNK
ncbi:hypothetical protein A2U01_0066162, partial [Trifolium medium]|nr:hypothetical protein [Trifolium medium]